MIHFSLVKKFFSTSITRLYIYIYIYPCAKTHTHAFLLHLLLLIFPIDQILLNIILNFFISVRIIFTILQLSRALHYCTFLINEHRLRIFKKPYSNSYQSYYISFHFTFYSSLFLPTNKTSS